MDEITVKPAVNQANATFVFLDEDGAELTDADTLQDDFQVSLAEGANTIKVKVTAEDGMATQTYTVVVTRCDAVWCATLTVGSLGGDFLGYSDISAGAEYGALTPRQFDHNSESIRVDRLAFDTDNDELAFYWTGDLGSSNYTLQLDGVHLAVLVPGNVGGTDYRHLRHRLDRQRDRDGEAVRGTGGSDRLRRRDAELVGLRSNR